MALEKAERVGDAELIAGAIARVGQMEMWAAEITPGLLERGVEMEERLGLALDYQTSPSVSLARLMTRLGEIQRSRVMSEELERKAVARGDEGTRTLILWSLSEIEWLAGNWRQALDHAAAAQELGEQRFPPNRCLGGPRPSARGGGPRPGRGGARTCRGRHCLRPGVLTRDLRGSLSRRARPAGARARQPAGCGRVPTGVARTPDRGRAPRPGATHLGRRGRDADRPRRARAGAHLPRAP